MTFSQRENAPEYVVLKSSSLEYAIGRGQYSFEDFVEMVLRREVPLKKMKKGLSFKRRTIDDL